jgi:hypothetical protein
MDPQVAFWIAQSISVVTTLIAILCMQLKKMNMILLCQITSNFLAGLTYLLLGGISGLGISIIAVVQSVIMYFYGKKGKSPHPIVTVAFCASYFACSLLVYQSIFDILPAAAAVFFALSVAQKKPSNYRIFAAINPIFWIAYDIYTLAYVYILMHSGILISAVVGIIRLDVLGRKKSDTVNISEQN